MNTRTLLIAAICAVFVAGYATITMAEDDAFAVLEQLEKNYVGLEKPGLDTLAAKANCSLSPKTDVMIYWMKGKGVKAKAEGDGTDSMVAKQMVEAYIRLTGLGIKTQKEMFGFNKDNVKITSEPAVLKDGTKVTQLTIVPKDDKKAKELGFIKTIFMIDTKEWVLRQSKITTKEGEAVVDFEYKDGLITKMSATTLSASTVVTNTYATVDKFTVPAKTEVSMDGKEIPDNMKKITISYSDVKVNGKIPDEIFAEPKAGDVPKPTENAAQLFQQVQQAMQKGDMETARLKLKQIVTYYPDDPMAKAAEMMLQNLPE
ncbi:MAG: hypothetical protein HY811_09790 [Planctomycetes bacterium]|nr:hypothetical protein [Planctomycetota bacterium]